MHPKQLSINDFTYTLPLDRIAYYPIAERDQSKLIHYKNRIITEDRYRHLHQYIPAGSLLVFNNTKVIEARLLFQKNTGAIVEIFCLEPRTPHTGIAAAMQQRGSVIWNCLIGGASKWKKGEILEKKIQWQNCELTVQAKYVEKISDSFAIELSWVPSNLSFEEVLHASGVMPLPPYIKRPVMDADAERYQTIYAEKHGSVAAPTAGLHFTPAIFTALEEKRVNLEFVTLHVGAGTFKPVKAATMVLHDMHGEYIDIPLTTIENILFYTKSVITAVGTTSLRTLESLYWLGVKILLQPGVSLAELHVRQWDPYDLPSNEISPAYALQALINWLKENNQQRLITTTQLLIAPGYPFKIVKALITNFHQPKSTLLLLVAAFIGEDWKKVYDYALKNEFRFLSYGDGCLLQCY